MKEYLFFTKFFQIPLKTFQSNNLRMIKLIIFNSCDNKF